MYLNWNAAIAPLVSILVFAGGVLVQLRWTRSSAKELARWVGTDDKGDPKPEEEIREIREKILDRLSLDADRVQLVATIAVVPPSLLLVFDVPRVWIPFIVAACVLLVVAVIAVLEVVTPEGNRINKPNAGKPARTGLLSLLSKISVVTAAALFVYFLAVLLFTPADATATIGLLAPTPTPTSRP